MKRFTLSILVCFICFSLYAQNEEAAKLYENAKSFMVQRDYSNASLILVRAAKIDPENISIAKDLAISYFIQKEYDKGVKVIVPFLDKPNTDDQAFQIAGMLYKGLGKFKDAENVYKKGIKKFPKGGTLYNDYGEMLYNAQDANCIKIWEEGIKMDPAYGNNYFNASKYYYLIKEKVWSLIYGEIFINIESFTPRTTEMKKYLLEGYKRLFSEIDLVKDTKGKNPFEVAFLTDMNKQNDVVQRGIDAETLTMIRTRFILQWQEEYKDKFPFYLFDLYDHLLKLGFFPAYNQWIFGAAQNLEAYDNWTKIHSKENNAFTKFQKDRLFKMPEGQYYH